MPGRQGDIISQIENFKHFVISKNQAHFVISKN